MARKPRVHFPGALYHVIARGNQRQRTFRSNSDRSRYLDLLKQYRERYSFNLYAYVLMGNHVHLLLEAGQVPLAKVMQGLQQSYTLYFNRKYNLVGHLFQGRYRAILCDRDSYLLELVRYLHLNPVRSKLVKDPAEYRWSSHGIYLGKGAGQTKFVQTEWILSQFSKNRSEARRRYRQFVLEGIGDGHRDDFYTTKEQQYLGDDDFVEEVTRRIEGEEPGTIRINLEQIEKVVCRHYDVSSELLQSRSKERRGSFGRAVIAHLAVESGGIKLKDVAQRYNRDQVSLSLGLKRLRDRMREEAQVKSGVEKLTKQLVKGL